MWLGLFTLAGLIVLPVLLMALPVVISGTHSTSAPSVAVNRSVANLYRRRAVALLRAHLLQPRPLPAAAAGIARRDIVVSRPDLRRELSFVMLAWIPGLVGGLLVYALLFLGVLFSTMLLWAPTSAALGSWQVPVGVRVAFTFTGLLLATTGVLATRALAYGEYRFMRGFLDPDEAAALAARVAELTSSRAGAVDSALTERRRIERDLHDGTQQRLTALAMHLGLLRARVQSTPDVPPEVTADIVDAHEQAKDALADLRAVVRGLHPAVLDDRGLDAALAGVLARSPVPAQLHARLTTRPSPTAESIAYFVVSEALTNVAKHSSATRVDVDVRSNPRTLSIQVVDDGRGGADPRRGTGLTGLRSRVEAVDGRFELTSPAGGGTELRVELACEL